MKVDYLNRRHKKDLTLRLISFAVLACWFLMAVAVVMLGLAKPEPPNPVGMLRGDETPMDQRPMDWQMLDTLFYVMIAGLIISIIGLMLNSRRMKRKGDHWSLTLLFMGLASSAGIISYLIQ